MNSEDKNKKVEEVQLLENHLQHFLMQKQSMQAELNEVVNAADELNKSDGEVYKLISGMMIKSTKEKLAEELGEKKNLLEMRINSIEKQEKLLEKNVSKLRFELVDKKS